MKHTINTFKLERSFLMNKDNLKSDKKKKKYKLEELLKGITAENKQEEMITDRQGKELI